MTALRFYCVRVDKGNGHFRLAARRGHCYVTRGFVQNIPPYVTLLITYSTLVGPQALVKSDTL